MDNNNKTIFHIDINSCYLSVEAVYRIQQGSSLDLREVPAVVGGDEESRHGIVLAKSIPAKKYNIQTGETLFSARDKCKELVIVPPRYSLYIKSSNAMLEILQEYTPKIQHFSIDECFLDFTGMDNLYSDYIELAYTIKDRIKRELGFTVNIGISSNKLLAKVASDFSKPDKVHTLFTHEIKKKMWPLPVEDLFMVGRATVPKLHMLNIFTIGDLAKYDLNIIMHSLKSHGAMIWNYANGIDNSEVRKSNHIGMKGIGNSTTTSFDVIDRKTAHLFIISLVETVSMVSMRLRNSNNCCSVVSISIRNINFFNYSMQRKLNYPTDITDDISRIACKLFDELWNGVPIRHLGIHVTELCNNDFYQVTFFEDRNKDKKRALDKTIDLIRTKYGTDAVKRTVFLHSGVNHIMGGGVGEEEDYPIMTSIL